MKTLKERSGNNTFKVSRYYAQLLIVKPLHSYWCKFV